MLSPFVDRTSTLVAGHWASKPVLGTPGAKLPRHETENGEDEPVFPGTTMELVVSLIPHKHPRLPSIEDARLIFEVAAATGMRRDELLGLKGRDLRLSGERPFIDVQRQVFWEPGEGWRQDAPKWNSQRKIPITWELADKLRAPHVADDAYVFPNSNGGPLNGDNLVSRVLKPACAEAGVEWASFKTFRTTYATRLAQQEPIPRRAQQRLGHKRLATTLEFYVKLEPGDELGEPLEPRELRSTGTAPEPHRAPLHGESGDSDSAT
jgi:integrase